jgi:signal transduction histidine kinase
MMTRVFWLLRVSGYAVIGLVALVNPPGSAGQRALQIGCFAVIGLGLAAWLAADLVPRYRPRCLPVALGVIAVAGGIAGVTDGTGQTLVAFACVAAFWAGSETTLRATIAAAVAGIVPILVAGPLTGSTFGTIAGMPLLIAVAATIGLNRHSYQIQAEQAAALLAQRERLQAEQRRADVLDERTRIAREVHDVLAHSLSALSLNLQGARLMLARENASDEAQDQIQRAQRLAVEGLAEARRAVAALREDPVPAARAIADLVTSSRLESGTPTDFTVDGTPRELPGPAEDALYRTAQEALSNTRKHAAGAPVSVVLAYRDDSTELTVTDHQGHRPAGPPTGGYGLTGMRERAELIGGRLCTGPTDDGWQVRLVVPT